MTPEKKKIYLDMLSPICDNPTQEELDFVFNYVEKYNNQFAYSYGGSTWSPNTNTNPHEITQNHIIAISKVWKLSKKTGCEVIMVDSPKFEYNEVEKVIGTVEIRKKISRTDMEDLRQPVDVQKQNHEKDLFEEYLDMIEIEMYCSDRMYIYYLCQTISIISESTFAPVISLRGRILFDNKNKKVLYHVPTGKYFSESELKKRSDSWIDNSGVEYDDNDILYQSKIKKLIMDKKLEIDLINVDIIKYKNILSSFSFKEIEVTDESILDKRIDKIIK